MRAKSPLFKRKKGVGDFWLLYQGLAQPTSDNKSSVHAHILRAQTSVVLTKLTFREMQVMVFQLSQGCQKTLFLFFILFNL